MQHLDEPSFVIRSDDAVKQPLLRLRPLRQWSCSAAGRHRSGAAKWTGGRAWWPGAGTRPFCSSICSAAVMLDRSRPSAWAISDGLMPGCAPISARASACTGASPVSASAAARLCCAASCARRRWKRQPVRQVGAWSDMRRTMRGRGRGCKLVSRPTTFRRVSIRGGGDAAGRTGGGGDGRWLRAGGGDGGASGAGRLPGRGAGHQPGGGRGQCGAVRRPGRGLRRGRCRLGRGGPGGGAGARMGWSGCW